ncbi:MAG: MBOAT family O-acyltransferase [Limnohabitans sp.]|nr:MBOAT family O-acyltransferase [Limnohabitans sp.]
MSFFGLGKNPVLLKIILPIGISFYTFHGLSYIIDIYNGKIKAEKDIITYSLFVNFFPLLVAGPIERATHLIPQIKKQRTFIYSKSVDGLRQILWGLFKKVVIADQCAEQVNIIFNNYQDYSFIGLLIGAVLFSFQIYGDFSGYSDIALGTARLFGFELLQNFSFPYFSRDIAEFWRRWHISLSSWFKDYLYIPLGGNKGSNWAKIRNTLIIFLVSGFWHGANWTFITWGLLNALYIIPLILFKKNRNNIEIVASNKYLPNLKELVSIIITFSLTTFAWIFFRATSVKQAFNYISNIIFLSTNGKLNSSCDKLTFFLLFSLIVSFIFIEWIGRREKFAIEKFGLNWKFYYRNLFYLILIISLFIFGGKQKQFIYFDF